MTIRPIYVCCYRSCFPSPPLPLLTMSSKRLTNIAHFAFSYKLSSISCKIPALRLPLYHSNLESFPPDVVNEPVTFYFWNLHTNYIFEACIDPASSSYPQFCDGLGKESSFLDFVDICSALTPGKAHIRKSTTISEIDTFLSMFLCISKFAS